jgi:hypothetical protein
MNEKLITVARFTSYIEADLARQRLEDEGIHAVVTGENVGNVYSGVPAAIDIELQTLETQVEAARRALEAFETHTGAGEGEDDEPDDDGGQE